MATPSTSNVPRGTFKPPGKGPAKGAPAKPGGIKAALTKKAGPLPVWVWGAGGLLVVAAFLYFRSQAGASTTTAGTPSSATTDPSGSGSGGGTATSTGGGSTGGTTQDYGGSGGGSGSASAGPSSPAASSTVNPSNPVVTPTYTTAYGLKPGTVVTPKITLPSGYTQKIAVTNAGQTAEPTATGYGAPQVRAPSAQVSKAAGAAEAKKAVAKAPAKTTTPAGFTPPKTVPKVTVKAPTPASVTGHAGVRKA